MRKKIEFQEQCALLQLLQYQLPDVYEYTHASPNGGSRNVLEAANLKKSGTKAGFPDLFIAIPNEIYHGLFIEMKSKRNAKLTPKQKEWYNRLIKHNYAVYLCYSAEDAFNIINMYMSK